MDDMFVPANQVLTIDLHEMTVAEAKYTLEKELNTAPCDIKIVEVIHGFHKGQEIMKMVRTEFRHPRIKRKYLTMNKGITRFELTDIKELDISKK